MTREEAHKLVDAVFHFAGAIVTPGQADVCRHLRAARREALLGVRALIDAALTQAQLRAQGDGVKSGPHSVPID